ncbi:MAG: glucose-6-phosphate dehydrogenase assembly protein OpcA [Bryobacteraceae bacterium]
MSATVAPDKILKELAELWVSAAKAADGGAGVLRACSMTLLVLAEESEDSQGLGETIAALMPEHPARAIVVRMSGPGERSLTGRVYSQCWMPFGQRKQICCEQVEITASDAALADLPSVVLPLAVPDLPLILWCRSPRLAAMPEFLPIAGMAQKVVLDSGPMKDPAAALKLMAALNARGVLLGDLSWTRLTRWREMLAQVFENQQYLAQLEKISDVKVERGEGYRVSALYMAMWLTDCLADAGVPDVSFGVGPAPEGVSVRVQLAGDGLAVELARREDRMVVTVNGVSQCTSLSQPTDYLLMREELGIVRRDPVFERALTRAASRALPSEGK